MTPRTEERSGLLLICFLGDPRVGSSELPRVALWTSDGALRVVTLARESRELVVHLAVPRLERLDVGGSSRGGERLATRLGGPLPNVGNAELRNAGFARTTLWRYRERLRADLASQGLESHLHVARGYQALRNAASDIALLFSAVRDERWDDAFAVLRVVALERPERVDLVLAQPWRGPALSHINDALRQAKDNYVARFPSGGVDTARDDPEEVLRGEVVDGDADAAAGAVGTERRLPVPSMRRLPAPLGRAPVPWAAPASNRAGRSRGPRRAAVAVAVAVVAVIGGALASAPDRTGPEHGDRWAHASGPQPGEPLPAGYRCVGSGGCPGLPQPTMNRYLDSPEYGDERYFFDAKPVYYDLTLAGPRENTDEGGFGNSWRVRDDQDLLLRVYVNNNGASNQIAEDVRLRVVLPAKVSLKHAMRAEISAANTTPRAVFDLLELAGSRPFRVRFLRGTARLHAPAGNGAWTERRLPDAITTPAGAVLGRWRPGLSHRRFVTMRVRVEMPIDAFPPGLEKAREELKRPAASDPVVEVGERLMHRCGRHDGRFVCTAGRYPQLNLFVGHPVLGDESDFLRVSNNTYFARLGGTAFEKAIFARPGDTLTFQVLAHNGGLDDESDSLAVRGTRVAMQVGSGVSDHLNVIAWLPTRNGRPRVITDAVPVLSDGVIDLRYVRGSAYLSSRILEHERLPDTIHADPPKHTRIAMGRAIRNGPRIGFSGRDGVIPPGERVYVRFDVTVHRG